MKKESKRYSIPQEILYSVCLTAWKLCSDNREEFAKLKAYYTEAFIADAIEAVVKAKQLPDLVQTSSERKRARINLISGAGPVLGNWQLLKRYITEAYEMNLVEVNLEAAGYLLYKKATLHHWTAVRSLIDTANIFIADNLDKLTANGNMPLSFQASFKDAGENFINLSVSFYALKYDKNMHTRTKVDANNAIYTSVIEMMKDGQLIFRNNAADKKQFIFKHLLSIQRGEGSASLKGYIVNSINQPVEGASIISGDMKYTATTDSKGYYRISRISAGTYTFTITCSGYEPVEKTITFAAATASKADFIMAGLMLKVA